MIARTPNTFIIGAGPVATALAGALRRGGIPVLGLWARDPASARAAGAVAGVASYSAAPPDLLLESDVVIVAVRDEAIAEVATMLCATGLITSKHVMLHCSGAMSARTAFGAISAKVGGVAVLHPLRAIADARAAMSSMAQTVFGIEGDDEGLAAARDLVAALAGRPMLLSGAQMAAYHAAAAVASNYLVALLDSATTLLASAGVPAADGLAALMPLVEGSLANIKAKGTAAGLTGPIRRGDLQTVARHLDAMAALPPEISAIYRVLGRRTVALARTLDDTDDARLDSIDDLLAGVTGEDEEPPVTEGPRVAQ